MKFKSLRVFGIILLALFIMSMSECDIGKDDPPTEENGNVVDIFESADPRSGSTIRVNSEITITFNKTPENVSVNKGNIVSQSGNRVTIKGPFDPGELVVKVEWKGGSENLKYNVEGAVFSTATPSEGSTITPFTDIIVTFKGNPEGMEVSHGTFTVSGSTVTITGPFFELGLFPFEIKWTDGSEKLTYAINETPVAKIEKVWTDYDVLSVSGGEKGMRIHVKFQAWYMPSDSASVIAYFYFRNGQPLKDFNDKFDTIDGKVAALSNFNPDFFRTKYDDFTIFMPYSELHMADGRHDLKYVVRIFNHEIDEFIHVSEHTVNFWYEK